MVLTAVNNAGTDEIDASPRVWFSCRRLVRTGGYSTAQGCELKANRAGAGAADIRNGSVT